MEDDPSIAEKIQTGIEREGSNLSGVSAKCWQVPLIIFREIVIDIWNKHAILLCFLQVGPSE